MKKLGPGIGAAWTILFCGVCLLAGEAKLPDPHYDFEPNDPAWLKQAVQFHGHLGPWAAAGVRLGMAARDAAGTKGYFDLEVIVEGPFAQPPKSCFLDGVQVATGATWGKRNIEWKPADEIVVRVRNLRTGLVAEARPSDELIKLATSFKPKPKVSGAVEPSAEEERHDEELEALARKIAHLPADSLGTVTLLRPREASKSSGESAR